MGDALLHNHRIARKKRDAVDDVSGHLIGQIHLKREWKRTQEGFLIVKDSRSVPPMPVIRNNLLLQIRRKGPTGHVVCQSPKLELDGIGAGRVALR